MKKVLVFLVIINSLNVLCQEENTKTSSNFVSVFAGVQTAQINSPILGINYKCSLSKKWWFKTGVVYTSFKGDPLMEDSLLYASNAIKINRDQTQFNRSFLLSNGVQYYPIKYLRVGLDVVIGFNQAHNGILDNAQRYDSVAGIWIHDNSVIADEYPDLFSNYNFDNTSANINQGYTAYLGYASYLVYGGALSIGGCLPIGERWELGLDFTTHFLRYSYQNNHSLASELNFEGMNVYPNIENIVTVPTSFNLWNHSLSISIGFGF